MGQINILMEIKNNQMSFIYDGVVDLGRQVEALCFHILCGEDFGYQKPLNGKV